MPSLKKQKQQILKVIRREYVEGISKDRNRENRRRFFDLSKKQEYTLDNQTWNDLDMDKVYDKLDRNYSSLGEAVLHCMLRNPLMDEEKLKDRNRLIEFFKNNADIRENCNLFFLNYIRISMERTCRASRLFLECQG